MNRVAIYCRLSAEDKNKKNLSDDSVSILNQKELLTDYAEKNNWDIYDIYSDDDYSGLSTERPEFNRMIKDAEQRKFDIILCKNQSRFTRDLEILSKYLYKKFMLWNITFKSIEDSIDTSDAKNMLFSQFHGIMNESYSSKNSESIKTIFRFKQGKGDFIGSFAPYGYDKDPNNKNKLIIDEEAAFVVKQIFKLYLEGNGTKRIASMLNEEGILNPTKYKQERGSLYVNRSIKNDYGLWNKTTVTRMLKNEMYIGNMVQHKREKTSYKLKVVRNLEKDKHIIVNETHEAIIDKEIFSLVQDRIKSNKRSTVEGKVHIFSGKVKCMDCGSTMVKCCNGKDYNYLRCKLYEEAPKKKLCQSHSIRLDHLEEVVANELSKHINKLCDTDRICIELVRLYKKNDKVEHEKKSLKQILKEIETKKRAIRELYSDKANGRLSQEQYNEFYVAFSSEVEVLIVRRDSLQSSINKFSDEVDCFEKYASIIDKYKNLEMLTHIMAIELIDYIEIGVLDKNKNEREIKIHWKF